ncbi:hypothetical protein PIB30_055765, partial [Stylosanthes scabra]|nr:hypothetical protein [Stylosanthes scabra]
MVTRGGEPRVTNRHGPKAQAVCRAMILNPPPLMAAISPWNRGTTQRHDQGAEPHVVVVDNELGLKHSSAQAGGVAKEG